MRPPSLLQHTRLRGSLLTECGTLLRQSSAQAHTGRVSGVHLGRSSVGRWHPRHDGQPGIWIQSQSDTTLKLIRKLPVNSESESAGDSPGAPLGSPPGIIASRRTLPPVGLGRMPAFYPAGAESRARCPNPAFDRMKSCRHHTAV